MLPGGNFPRQWRLTLGRARLQGLLRCDGTLDRFVPLGIRAEAFCCSLILHGVEVHDPCVERSAAAGPTPRSLRCHDHVAGDGGRGRLDLLARQAGINPGMAVSAPLQRAVIQMQSLAR